MSSPENGWIKVHRKIHESEMYRQLTSKQRSILLDLLLLANHSPRTWTYNGETFHLEPGQFRTTLKDIGDCCAKDVTVQNIRTCLLVLEKWQFLTSKSTNKNRLITICNWARYQDDANKQTNKQLTSNQQATNKRFYIYKNDKNEENDISAVALIDIQKNEVYQYWEEKIAPITNTQETQRKASVTLLNRYGLENCQKMIRVVAYAHSDKFARKEVKVQSLGALLNSWDKLVIYAKSVTVQHQRKGVPSV